VSYIKDVYSKIRSKTTCFDLIWPSSGYIAKTLREKEKPDDGHIRPKHVVLFLILEYTSFI